MALAGNTVRAARGGLCVVADGEVLASMDLPLAGLVSEAPLARVAEHFSAVRAVLDELVDWAPPYLVFKALFGASLVCNAGPRLSDVGLVDVFERTLLETPILGPGRAPE
jgi:adenine deaminase